MLSWPEATQGIVLFAHGSGSSRFSPRNQSVARALQGAGFATLLIDLLTAYEDEEDRVTRDLRFNISLLGGRLADILDWIVTEPTMQTVPVGLFGASTGAAAALVAATWRSDVVRAVVSRGGRPDLAAAVLHEVRAPTLLIVGALDPEVLALNREALAKLPGTKELAIVAGATHLFEEPGTLEQVARLAIAWCVRYLRPPGG
jgi:dienelactone hydrolase